MIDSSIKKNDYKTLFFFLHKYTSFFIYELPFSIVVIIIIFCLNCITSVLSKHQIDEHYFNRNGKEKYFIQNHQKKQFFPEISCVIRNARGKDQMVLSKFTTHLKFSKLQMMDRKNKFGSGFRKCRMSNEEETKLLII